MKTFKKTYLSICCLMLLIMQQVYAQPGTNDASFNVADNFSGFNGVINTTVVQPDGKVMVGGNFSLYNGNEVNNIVRLNSDGTLDQSFKLQYESGRINEVITIVLQTDGKIIVGGNIFKKFSASTIDVIRLNPDGSLDESFNIGNDFNGNKVNSIAIQKDGKIVITGDFVNINNLIPGGITRLNSDGSLDKSFDVGFGLTGGEFNSVVIQSDGKILVGGIIYYYNRISVKNLVRINTDGSLDESFNKASLGIGRILSLAIQSNGKILVGGNFTKVNNVSTNGIIRLNSDGTLDENFSINPLNDINSNEVKSIKLQSDGKIVHSLKLIKTNSITSELIRLNPDGTNDSEFNIGIGPNSDINFIDIQSDNKIIAAGFFTSFNTTTTGGIVRLNNDGQVDKSFNTALGFNNSVNTLAIQSDGKIIAGGSFDSFNNGLKGKIVRLNIDGSNDGNFKIGSGFDSNVNSVAIQSDGKIVVGGSFELFNGKTLKNIVRLKTDGSLDESFKTGSEFDGFVSSVVIQPDGKIVVGGYFKLFNGKILNNIARLNTDGTIDENFNVGTGFDNFVSSILIQSDRKIIVSGYFTNYNGSIINKIVRLNPDGSLDNNFKTSSESNDRINSFALQSDGKIVVALAFYENGNSKNRLYRLNIDGTLDNSFNILHMSYSVISKILVQSDDKIIVTGGPLQTEEVATTGIFRLNSNGTLDKSFIVGKGFRDFYGVNSAVIQSDGKIIVGGGFSNYNGIPRNKIARLNGDSNLSTEENEISKSVNSIYPNPSNGIFNVKTDLLGKNYFITDAVGRIISTGIISENNTHLNLQNQPNGLYFVKLDNETFKIIKN